jgi:hypothetical protein
MTGAQPHGNHCVKHDGSRTGNRPPQAQAPVEQDTTEEPRARGEAPVKHIEDQAGQRIEKQGAQPLGKHQDNEAEGRDAEGSCSAGGAGRGAAPDKNNDP